MHVVVCMCGCHCFNLVYVVFCEVVALWLFGFALAAFSYCPCLRCGVCVAYVLEVVALWLCGFASAAVPGLAHVYLMCAAAVFAALVHHSCETCAWKCYLGVKCKVATSMGEAKNVEHK